VRALVDPHVLPPTPPTRAGLSSRRDAEAAYFEPLADRGELDLDPDDHRSPPLFR
jgi:hypothetical protein